MTTTSEALNNSNNPAAARVQLLPAPVASPGMCGICGKNEHPDGFADARLDFEFYGTFYLCGDCVGDYARLFGWLHPMQARALAQKYQELSDELDLHRKALLNLEESVEHLTNYRMLRSTITGTEPGNDLDATSSDPDEETIDAVSGSVIEFPGADNPSESDVSEPVTEQGPDDVPEPRGDESSSDITIVEL
jgi:hypothetical protein